jgi:hypothetical protein
VTYFKCESCRTRLYSAAQPDRLVRDVCPKCGAVLRAVAELSEVVGYRSIAPRRGPIRLGAPPFGHAPVTDRFAELQTLRRASAARERLDAERWLDDGGRFDGAAAPPSLSAR